MLLDERTAVEGKHHIMGQNGSIRHLCMTTVPRAWTVGAIDTTYLLGVVGGQAQLLLQVVAVALQPLRQATHRPCIVCYPRSVTAERRRGDEAKSEMEVGQLVAWGDTYGIRGDTYCILAGVLLARHVTYRRRR